MQNADSFGPFRVRGYGGSPMGAPRANRNRRAQTVRWILPTVVVLVWSGFAERVGRAQLSKESPLVEISNFIDMQFVRVPPGPGVAEGIYVSKTEVTLGQFRRFKPNHDNGRTPWGRSLDHPDLPVVGVSVAQTKEFCEWLGQRDGGTYRLPTPAEFDHVARAGRRGRYGFGDSTLQLRHYGWYDENAAGMLVPKPNKGPRPVAQKLPNAWGLFDVHGNVWEWCLDANGQATARGGGWNSPADQCHAGSVLTSPPASELTIGFRVVMVKPPTDDNYGQVYWHRVGRKVVEPLVAPAIRTGAIPKDAHVAVIPPALDGRGTTQLGILLGSGIESALIETGTFRIVDRQTLDQVLSEKDLAFADLTDASKASLASKALAADLLVNGTLTDTGNELQGTLRLVGVAKAEVLSTTAFSLPKDEKVGSLMVVVQRPRHRTDTGGELPPLVISYDVLAQREVSGGRFEEILVREGATLRSGDQYRIRVQASSDCHFYILTYDSRGEVYVLFPRPEIQLGASIRGGVTYMIPGEHDPWFTLDEHIGTETLILLASYEPLNDLDALVRRMRAAGGSSPSAQSAIKQEVEKLSAMQDVEGTVAGYRIGRTRGTVLARPKASYTLSNGRPVQNVMAVAEGRSRVVHMISFHHVK